MTPKLLLKDASNIFKISVQAIHKKIKKLNLTCEKASNKTFITHEIARKLFNIDFKQKVIAIQVVKGGTGKSTIASSLSIALSLLGAKVLCIDLDQQANLTSSFGVEPDRDTPVMVDVVDGIAKIKECILEIIPGLHLIPSRIDNAVIDSIIINKRKNLKKLYNLEELKSIYDYIIIDCPPALSNSVAAATLASDCVICPIAPEASSLEGLDLSYTEFKRLQEEYDKKIDIKILQNKFDVRTSLSHTVMAHLVSGEYNRDIFNSRIRVSQEFPNCYYKGISVFDKTKQTPAKEDIFLLAQEILEIGDFSKDLDVRKVTNKSKSEKVACV